MAISKITTSGVATDTLTAADLAPNSVDSSELIDGAVDLSHMSVNSIDSDQYVDASIDTAHIGDDQVTLAKMAGGTDGQVITYDASGDPVAVGPGTDGQVLTSTGAGSPPAFEAVPSFNADAAQVFNDTGADVDFRVEGSGQANALFVQGSDGDIGIGTGSPDSQLEILSAADNTTPFTVRDVSDGFNIFRVTTAADGSGIVGMKNGANAETIILNSNGDSYFNGGRVGIGNTAPSPWKLLVTDDSGGGIQVDSSVNSQGINLNMKHASYTSDAIFIDCNRAAAGYLFLQLMSGNESDNEFLFYGTGTAYADTAWSIGADYAEFFESTDGSGIPFGTTVVLENGKIRASIASEQPMGVIRPADASTNIGNSAWNKWTNKHLRTDYGNYLREEYSQTEWTDVDGKEHSYQTDLIPADVTVPADATVISEDDKGNKLDRRKMNPDWDSTIEYIPRADRDEWHIVGLLGQIPITKGQPVADTWIKMRDVSATVEMWFVK